jgi:hypothetical protein
MAWCSVKAQGNWLEKYRKILKFIKIVAIPSVTWIRILKFIECLMENQPNYDQIQKHSFMSTTFL